MSNQSIQPLRVPKGTPGSSPKKMSAAISRPLAELSPMAIRRNSPSFPQANKNSIFKGENSPFDYSPQNTSASSPRMFWQGRDPTSARASLDSRSQFELSTSPSPKKRSSIENLKKASRVKNSNIFALEQNHQYDPASPAILDRPLANGRPLNSQVQGNAFGGRGLEGMREEHAKSAYEAVTLSPDEAPLMEPSMDLATVAPLSPSKYSSSPAKSSLSKKTGKNARHTGFDPENGIWSDDVDTERTLPEGKGLHRHAKSVTFNENPPQVNEYEMTTPDPSSVASGSREGSYESMEDDEEEASFDRGSSYDREDSFDASLEDTDKTPVVLPEDWRFMSPDTANTALAQHEEDVFDDEYGSPAPSAQPGATAYRPQQSSFTSVDSNGQPRPLPPLPSTLAQGLPNSDSRHSLSGTIERLSSAQRTLPMPPQAPSVSKSDIRRMSGGSFSLDDRIRLMMLQDPDQHKTEAEKQRERRMRRGGSKEASPARDTNHPNQQAHLSSDGPGPSVDEEADHDQTPHLSRQSILQGLRSEQDLHDGFVRGESADIPSSLSLHGSIDPDVPIPSLEDPTQNRVSDEPEDILVKKEESDENDLYAIPDLYSRQLEAEVEAEDEDGSQYSDASLPPQPHLSYDETADTPRAQSPLREPEKKQLPSERISLPAFTDFGDQSSFDLGLDSYMTPPTERQAGIDPIATESTASNVLPDLAALRKQIQRPATPELQPPVSPFGHAEDKEPGTPDSVIRHPVSDQAEPVIAEPEATVKAAGTHLRTPASVLPAECETMAVTQGEVSDERSEVPAVPERHRSRPSLTLAQPQDSDTTSTSTVDEADASTADAKGPKKRVSSLVQLDIPASQSDDGLGLGLEEEFDRVVESQKVQFELSLQRLYYPFNGRFPSGEYPASKDSSGKLDFEDIPKLPKPHRARALPEDQTAHGHTYPTDGSAFANRTSPRQRGYLMRQNTKVVVASERVSHDEGRPVTSASGSSEAAAESSMTSPASRKTSQPTWTAEPWNGKSRRRSIKLASDKSPTKRKPVDGPAPPLPGQASNVQDALKSVAEDELAEEDAEDLEDGTERGRLFVKVVGVKDLDLPLPSHEQTSFALTLDNGLHCVTTAWLDLARDAPIGQEFELVVLNELEFQLTLQMKLEEPKIQRPVSPSKPPSSPTKKQGTFGRLFGSPRKRKESELKAQQEAHAAATRPVTPPSAYEMVQGLVAKDGSFARAYIALNEHEKQAFGRPYAVDIQCFNEWALEEVSVGSSRSKKSITQMQRRPPYAIGKLELQLMYIPKPKGAKDEDMPKSMNSAMRDLRDAEARLSQDPKEFEGHLSQQGGDCPYWRRRFFKLVGTKLTAYHESTLQPRATINLAKAAKLIDDKSSLMQKETSTKGGGRRKSAFAEEEEGYMFVEEGFRIRFANGEVIDFYADTAATKDEWMKVLSQVVGKPALASSAVSGWTEMVIKKQQSARRQQQAQQQVEASPRKSVPAQHQQPYLVQDRPSSQPTRSSAANPPAGLGIQHPNLQPRSIPQPSSNRSPPRPHAHVRTESYQPPHNVMASRSQVNSPVKEKVLPKISREERQRKVRSMYG